MTDYEQIEKYLNDELSAEERLAFEEQLKADTQLAEEFILYKNILQNMQGEFAAQSGQAAFLNSLEENQKKYFTRQQKAKVIAIHKNKRIWLSVIGIAAAVLVAVLLLPFLNKPKDAQQLYAQYAVHDSLATTLRGNDNDSFLLVIQQLYNSKQYTAALTLLQPYAASHPAELEYSFAEAICYLETRNYENAITLFQALAETESVLKYKAVWYLALTYLKQNKLVECKEALMQIPEEAYEYKDAQELLKEMK